MGINDLLHESIKFRENINMLDSLSIKILHFLPSIMKVCFSGYKQKKQEKLHSLLFLWLERKIFNQEQINFIGNYMMNLNYKFKNKNFWNNWGNWFIPISPTNLLHISPGF